MNEDSLRQKHELFFGRLPDLFPAGKFNLNFDLVLSREAGLWKPSGAPFLFVLEKLGVKKKQCCVVGDSHFDVKAAEEAGIKKIFILTQEKEKKFSRGVETVHTVEELELQLVSSSGV